LIFHIVKQTRETGLFDPEMIFQAQQVGRKATIGGYFPFFDHPKRNGGDLRKFRRPTIPERWCATILPQFEDGSEVDFSLKNQWFT
jgi:hypothetical protein